MFSIATIAVAISVIIGALIVAKEIRMNVQAIIDQLKNFKLGVSQDELNAAIAPLTADLEALKTAQAADADKFAAIQAALDANTAGDQTEQQAIQAIADVLAPKTAPEPEVAPETPAEGESAPTE